jgi:hypothetical protein
MMDDAERMHQYNSPLPGSLGPVKSAELKYIHPEDIREDKMESVFIAGAIGIVMAFACFGGFAARMLGII